jgi:hypothetical protein
MCTDRRNFLRLSAGVAGATLLGAGISYANTDDVEAIQQRQDVPDLIRNLRPMMAGVAPITADERKARIAKAQRLMGEQKIDAIYIESGTSMYYFTGMRWGQSERMFALVIPQRGELAWVCPKFEEERARELIKIGTNDIRTWEEDESPYRRVAEIIKDRGIRTGRIGIEERVRFFLYDGIRREAPKLEFVSATPITAGCRMYKSPAELALMQKANDLTIVAYRATWATMREGMTQQEFAGNCATAFRNLGAGRNLRQLWQVHGVSARQQPAADSARRRHGFDGRRMQCRRLPVGHHAHFCFRQTKSTTARHLGPRAQITGRRFRGRESRRAVRSCRLRRAKSFDRRGFRARLQNAGPAASHRPRHWTRRSRMDLLCARQQDTDPTGHVLQRRTDDCDLWRVWSSSGRLSLHH